MSQKPTRARNLGLAALLLTATVFSTAAHAQSANFLYTAPDLSGEHRYGVLNGQHVALYINDRGDLGAPYPIAGGFPVAKGGGNINPITGLPNPNNIAADGRVTAPSGNLPVYGALFSQMPTGGGNIGDSIKAKSEYITGGGNSAIENFSIFANNGLLPGNQFLRNSSVDGINVDSFSVSGTSASRALSATSNLSTDLRFANPATLSIQQVVSYQETPGAPQNRVRFSTDFTNNSTTDTLQNFRYARVVDANTAFGTNPATTQQFRTGADERAFALTSSSQSKIIGEKDNAIGIGVFGDGLPGAAPGTILFTAASSAEEDQLLQSPFDQVRFYVELTGGNGAVIKETLDNDLNTANDPVRFLTNDFINDKVFGGQVEASLGFGSANNSLVLLSPSFNIAPGQSQNFTFYYFFGGQINSTVPEPGTVALFAAGGLSGLWLRRRKVSRK